MNTKQKGWGGHWRGENATSETVICPLSYTTRHPLAAMCGLGYTVAAGELAFYFASDLVHRIYHLPAIGEAVVEHYADSYEDCLALATSDPAMAVRNTHSLQYFALDVYAYDIALPGEGCSGQATATTEEEATTTSDAPAVSSFFFSFLREMLTVKFRRSVILTMMALCTAREHNKHASMGMVKSEREAGSDELVVMKYEEIFMIGYINAFGG